MDRTAFAACAVVSAVLAAGCGAEPAPPPSSSAPLVLAELQAASPGPWRIESRMAPAPADLAPSADARGIPPAELRSADVPTLDRREAAIAPAPAASQPRYERPPQLRFAVPPADSAPPAGQPQKLLRNGPGRPLPPRGGVDETAAPLALPELSELAASRAEKLPAVAPAAAAPVFSTAAALPATRALQGGEVNAVLQEAEAHLRKGMGLAQRHALYLARSELIAALALIAQAGDADRQSACYSDALAAGLAALAECRDFVVERPDGKPIDLARVTSGHKTPILKHTGERLTPLVAAQRYYTFAQEQLAAAAAGQPLGSMALFGLGKVALALAREPGSSSLLGRGQAMALYQAALLVDSGNYRAANELGVLIARQGDWVRSRDLLEHSARLAPHPATYRNLAAAYAQLGRADLAAKAQSDAVAFEQAGHKGNGPVVEWVDPATFAAAAPSSDAVLPPIHAPSSLPGSNPTQTPPNDVSTARRNLSDFLPWSSRR